MIIVDVHQLITNIPLSLSLSLGQLCFFVAAELIDSSIALLMSFTIKVGMRISASGGGWGTPPPRRRNISVVSLLV